MSGSRREKMSVIIPVYNEEEGINRTIERTREISGEEDIEIIAVDGVPEGNTIGVIKDRTVIPLKSPRGRARQMNRGAESASGEILLFLHADTVLPNGAFHEIRKILSGGRFMAGAFRLGFDNRGLFFRLTEWTTWLRNMITSIPFGDQAYFIRKKDFEDLGSFSDIPLMEDFEFMRRIKRSGKRIRISDMKVITSARKWEADGILYTNMRNWILQLLYVMGASPEKLVKYYYREKKGN
jgi:rSAM/selenodomain-associated transferase 2